MALARVLCPTLCGREAELSTLEDALLAALRGDGGVVIVGGEAGMGKTRLVTELATRAKRLRCVVMSGACSEAELSLPYLPFLEAIGNRLTAENIEELRERLGPAVEELAQLFPQIGRAQPAGGDPMQAKLRMFEAILLLLRDAARGRALVLILEDLQWADPGTRELLDYMTRRLRSTNVLVLATYRIDEMHRKHPLVPTIQAWRRSGQAEFVELEALSAPAVADIVCTIFEERQLSDEFRDFLHDRSEGNPFVLEEMLRDALDRGDIFRTETGWDRKAVTEMRIPRTVRDTILHRLERLSRTDVDVLSAAAVAGRSFDLAILAAMTDLDQGAVLAALETCVMYQLLEEDDRGSGKYRFRHALTKEAVYDDMVVPRRQQLHARVADLLASRPDHAAVDLANHLLLAGRYEEAVEMCVTAAEDALRALAYRDAAELLERAAPYVRDPVERARMLCRAADCYWNNNESATARRLLEPAIADLEAAGLDLEAAGYRVLLGRCFWELLRSDLASDQFERAREVLEAAGPSEALAILYVRLAGMAQFNEELDIGLDYSRRAADIAERVGAGLAKTWSWNFMAGCEIGLGRVETGFGHMEDSYQSAVAGGYQFQIGNAVYNAVHCALLLGAGDRVAAWFVRVDSSWTQDLAPWPVYLRGLVALERGQVVEALGHARAAAQRSRDSGHQKMGWRSAVAIAHALAENMAPDEAAAVMPPVSSRVDVQDAAYDGAARIRVQLAAGDRAAAFESAKTVPANALHMAAPIDAIAEAADDPAWLSAFIDSAQLAGETLASPRLAAAKGRLALLEGRVEDALSKLGSAVAEFEDSGLLLDVWHIGRSLAEAEARAGDADGARRRLLAIVSEAEAHGARLAAKLARDAGSRLGLEMPEAVEARPELAHTARVATGERLVSVLFADVRGYTEMSGRSTPAGMAERITSLQRWVSQEVARRHGIVDKFAGDSVMATFNVSGQTVDHTVQALQAAIAIIDKAALAGLPVGAGIAVGPAVVGRLADGANISVLGEVTNLAARLEAQSAAGDVTLSEEAHRRVQDWLAEHRTPVERVELELKGFGGPVIAYRVSASVEAGIRA